MKRSFWTSFALLMLTFALTALFGCGEKTDPTGVQENPTGVQENGRIGVYPQPNSAEFPWTLSGPNGYSHPDSGDVVVTDLTPGEYTLTWGSKNGWVAPSMNPMVATLQSGAFLSFRATYRATGQAQPGQVQLDPNPDGLVAPWTLILPSGEEIVAAGDSTLNGMEPGDYTVVWGEVTGFETPEEMTDELIEGEGLTFVGDYQNLAASTFIFETIPAGSFWMGSSRTEPGTSPYEWPRHEVHLTQDFDMAITEVTWAQFTRVMGYNPSYQWTDEYEGGVFDAHPVDSVTWLEAIQFCNAASLIDDLTPVYTIVGDVVTWDQDADGYRLPTEAEWEYACRAGTRSALYNGSFVEDASSCYREANLDSIAWYCNNSARMTQAGRQLRPNAFSIYDMSGNLWEWTWDVSDTYDAVPIYLDEFDDGEEVFDSGNAKIVKPRTVFGDSLIVRLQYVNAQFAVSTLQVTPEEIRFKYLDFDDPAAPTTVENLKVNGGDMYIGDLASAPASPAPGVTMSVTWTEVHDTETEQDGIVGEVVLTGDVQSLIVGGEQLWIDDVDIIDSRTDEYGIDRFVSFDLQTRDSVFRPDGSPVTAELLLGCTVTDPIGIEQAAGVPHALRGGSFASTPRGCRSASRSEPAKSGRYAGFRFVRTIR